MDLFGIGSEMTRTVASASAKSLFLFISCILCAHLQRIGSCNVPIHHNGGGYKISTPSRENEIESDSGGERIRRGIHDAAGGSPMAVDTPALLERDGK